MLYFGDDFSSADVRAAEALEAVVDTQDKLLVTGLQNASRERCNDVGRSGRIPNLERPHTQLGRAGDRFSGAVWDGLPGERVHACLELISGHWSRVQIRIE